MRAWSARRVLTAAALLMLTPAAGVGAQEIAELQTRLAAAIGPTTWRGASWGVVVRSLDTGDTLFALDPDAPLAPASNLKLLTTAAALRILGPDYRFRTYLMTDGEVVDGVLEGDLVLYGTGDPGISDRFYRRKEDVFGLLIDQLAELGIHTVAGDLVGDASFFAGPLRPEGWHPNDLNDAFAGGVSALSFNENVVSFRVVAGAAGEAPAVYTVPENAGLEVVNSARTVAADARPRIAILRDHPLDPIRIDGRLLTGARDVWREMTVPVPAHFAASVFRATLEERGVTVEGSVRVVDDPGQSLLADGAITAPALGRRSTRVLARHVSDPLSVYLAVVNKESNNLFAELVFRALGRATSGVASPESASAAVRNALGELGVDMSGVIQLDGSGLSSGSRVSASTFVDVVASMFESPVWPEYWGSLPQAGTRREMSRMLGTPAAGNLRAKTGTIDGVSALTGMVRSRTGERLAFSMMVNGTRANARAKSVENRVGALLASFGRPLPADPALRFAAGLVDPGVDVASRYLVGRGESLAVIAERHGLALETLLAANPGVQVNRVVPGQWIELPRRGVTE
ncbi:MAG: D-alanyl-D-alanine carboxypeptidase/D-alanyl-D-alanine-endopeptidase [Gemmatimonadetes bacterium]|nr:D-alanyl-D-alanine carboxypeptidase/D-alanyl-D-alanine-endopeptidase [Gemmatimonadota bacterium]